MKKPIIISTPNAYGFGHDWTLVAEGKSFYLGQDVKFVRRAMCCEPQHVTNAIGTNDLSKPTARRKLAQFILDYFSLTPAKLRELQPWELCCQ